MRSSRDIARRRPQRRERLRILVVAEGAKTEVQYVQGLVQHLRRSGVAVRGTVTHGIGRDPERVLAAAERYSAEDPDGFDSVWVLLDVDKHAHLQRSLARAHAAGIRALVSNPCFELWLLWHFAQMNQHHDGEWLKQKLRQYGHDGKAISSAFPFEHYEAAVARALDPRRAVDCCVKGGNPSSAMPLLVETLLAGG